MANKAVRTPVRLGIRQGQRVEVLRKQTRQASEGRPAAWEDFTASDVVVRDNPSSLADGQEVPGQPR